MRHPTIDELLTEARAGLSRVAADDLAAAAATGALIVDIRPRDQRTRDGEIPGAVVIDRNVLEWRLAPSSPHRLLDLEPGHRVILVCNEGYSSSLAAATLQRLGLSNATDVIGGYQAMLALTPG